MVDPAVPELTPGYPPVAYQRSADVQRLREHMIKRKFCSTEGGTAPIIPRAASAETLTQLCPDLESWPQRWCYQDADIAIGERIVECLTPFLLHLLEQALATKTLHRYRDHLWMLGGEIIRRLHEEPALRRKPINIALLQSMDPECGPLIWPRITQQQQDSFDATCRKLYQFLTTNPKPPGQ